MDSTASSAQHDLQGENEDEAPSSFPHVEGQGKGEVLLSVHDRLPEPQLTIYRYPSIVWWVHRFMGHGSWVKGSSFSNPYPYLCIPIPLTPGRLPIPVQITSRIVVYCHAKMGWHRSALGGGH